MKKPIVFVALYFVVLGLFASMTFLLPASTFSPNENRYLAQMPALNGDTVLFKASRSMKLEEIIEALF